MKSFASLVIVAVIAATAFAAPATKAVDWAAVASTVSEVESTIRSATQNAVAVANADNAQVGQIIADKVDLASSQAAPLLGQLNDAVAAQTLTVGQVRALTGELKGVAGLLLGSIQPELAQLSAAASAQIRAILTTNFSDLENLATQLTALLGSNSSVLVVDWAAVSGKIGEIQTAVLTGGQEVVTAARNESETIGSSIAGKVESASVTAAGILEEANAAVQAETLTDLQAQDLISQLRGTMARLLGSLSTDLALVSVETDAQIRASFKTTFDAIDVIGLEISALLLA